MSLIDREAPTREIEWWPSLTADLGLDVDRDRLHAARSVVATHPACWRTICFETRWNDPRLDVAVAYSDADRADLANALGAAASETPGGSGPARGRARDLLTAWSMAVGPLETVPRVWLELDEPGWRDDADAFVFLTLLDPRAPDLAAMVPVDADSARRLGATALEHSGRRDDALVDSLAHAVDRLPPSGRLLHLAPLPPSRGLDALRLVVGLPWSAARDWLSAIDWPGTDRQWTQARDLFAHRAPYLQLALDLAPGPRSSLGVEAWARPAEWWQALHDDLRAHGVGVSADLSAVARWADGSPCVRRRGWWVRIQRQASIKVVIPATGELLPKVYRYARPSYVPAAVAARWSRVNVA